MFASLNTLRYELMHRWNLEDFEFSETYLFFWDAMEKSNPTGRVRHRSHTATTVYAVSS